MIQTLAHLERLDYERAIARLESEVEQLRHKLGNEKMVSLNALPLIQEMDAEIKLLRSEQSALKS